MKERTYRRLLSVLLALGILLTSCASLRPSPTPLARLPLKLVVLPFLSDAPLHIALAEGYFDEQGLDVETVRLQYSQDAMAALVVGEVDVFGGLVLAGTLNAIADGAVIKIVADKGHTATPDASCDAYAVLARTRLLEDGTLSDVASLRGMRVLSAEAAMLGLLANKVLALGNLTEDDVEVLELPPTVWPEALERGSLDVCFGAMEPWTTRILQSGVAKPWMSFKEVAPGYQFAVLMFGPTLLGEDREAGKRFMVAYLKGVRQYNEGKSERNLDILTDALGLERELLEQGCWPPIRSDGTVNLDSVLEFQDWVAEKGLVEKAVLPDQLYDASFIEYANKVLGPAE